MNLALGMGLNKMRHGALLNQNVPPVIPNGTPTSVLSFTNTTINVVSSVDTDIETVVTLEIGTSTGNYNLTPVAATESPISGTGDVNFAVSGLEQNTTYYFRVKAVNAGGTAYSAELSQKTDFYATLTSTGTGAGVSTLRLEVSENQTLEIISGTARFYTDAGGTTGESTTWSVTTGALRTIYLKAPSGSSVLNIQKPDKVTKWGSSSTDGWTSSTNAASITIEFSNLKLTVINISGNSTLTGMSTTLTFLLLVGPNINYNGNITLPGTLTYINIDDFATGKVNINIQNTITWGVIRLALLCNNIKYTSSDPITMTGNYLSINGANINWTGTIIVGNGDLFILNLSKYRTTKMSSADMVTLINSLINRTGGLPATITINDYADFASPPQSVTDAVAALKVAKPNVTTVNLGA